MFILTILGVTVIVTNPTLQTGHRGSERLSNSPTVTQMESGRDWNPGRLALKPRKIISTIILSNMVTTGHTWLFRPGRWLLQLWD